MSRPGSSVPAGGTRLAKAAAIGAMTASLLATTAVAGAGASSLTAEQSKALAGLEVIGHRAAPYAAPENTLAAIRHAINVQADAVEIDVMFTKNDKPVIFHDETLNAKTGCSGLLESYSYKRIKNCALDYWPDDSFAGERIPKLSHALELLETSKVRVYLHLKDVSGKKEARKLVKTVKRFDMLDSQVVAFADDTKRLKRVDKAGFSKKNLGFIFNARTDGWAEKYSKYRYLVPYNQTITREQVERAQSRGQKVIAVETSSVKLADLAHVGLDGFMANTLDETLVALGKRAAQPQASVRAQGAKSPGADEDFTPPPVIDDPTGS